MLLKFSYIYCTNPDIGRKSWGYWPKSKHTIEREGVEGLFGHLGKTRKDKVTRVLPVCRCIKNVHECTARGFKIFKQASWSASVAITTRRSTQFIAWTNCAKEESNATRHEESEETWHQLRHIKTWERCLQFIPFNMHRIDHTVCSRPSLMSKRRRNIRHDGHLGDIFA